MQNSLLSILTQRPDFPLVRTQVTRVPGSIPNDINRFRCFPWQGSSVIMALSPGVIPCRARRRLAQHSPSEHPFGPRPRPPPRPLPNIPCPNPLISSPL